MLGKLSQIAGGATVYNHLPRNGVIFRDNIPFRRDTPIANNRRIAEGDLVLFKSKRFGGTVDWTWAHGSLCRAICRRQETHDKVMEVLNRDQSSHDRRNAVPILIYVDQAFAVDHYRLGPIIAETGLLIDNVGGDDLVRCQVIYSADRAGFHSPAWARTWQIMQSTPWREYGSEQNDQEDVNRITYSILHKMLADGGIRVLFAVKQAPIPDLAADCSLITSANADESVVIMRRSLAAMINHPGQSRRQAEESIKCGVWMTRHHFRGCIPDENEITREPRLFDDDRMVRGEKDGRCNQLCASHVLDLVNEIYDAEGAELIGFPIVAGVFHLNAGEAEIQEVVVVPVQEGYPINGL